MNDAPTAAPKNASSKEKKRQEISELDGSEMTPGRSCDARSLTGTMRLKISPSARPGRVSLSGNRLVSASVKIRPNNRKPSTQHLSAARVNPNFAYQVRNRTAVSSSTTI